MLKLFNTLCTLLWPPAQAEPDHRLYELVLDEAQRTMSQQQSVLDNLRNRSGTLLAAASIVTSFLGGAALDDGTVSPVGWLAVGLFVLSTVSIVYILMPRSGYTFSLDTDDLMRRYITSDRVWSLPDVQADLARWWDKYTERNQQKIDTLMYAYQGSALLLMAAIVLFIVELWLWGGGNING